MNGGKCKPSFEKIKTRFYVRPRNGRRVQKSLVGLVISKTQAVRPKPKTAIYNPTFLEALASLLRFLDDSLTSLNENSARPKLYATCVQ